MMFSAGRTIPFVPKTCLSSMVNRRIGSKVSSRSCKTIISYFSGGFVFKLGENLKYPFCSPFSKLLNHIENGVPADMIHQQKRVQKYFSTFDHFLQHLIYSFVIAMITIILLRYPRGCVKYFWAES